MAKLDEIKSRLKEQLKEEPGIMSFAYPYVGLWSKLGETDVTNALRTAQQEHNCGILYAHIPFCLSKCGYCDYASTYGTENRHDEYKSYVDAVEREIKLLAPATDKLVFGAVYFGGGTPTILCENGLERMIRLVSSNFSLSPSAEISIEVYPWKKMLRNKLELLRRNGINRVSIGVQDFNDEVIAFTGRKYAGKEASEVVAEAMKLFSAVNVDLICGLPKQTSWEQTLETTLQLNPQQVTVQPFSNRHSGIRFNQQRYRSLLPGLGEMIKMYDSACDKLVRAGYRQTSRHQFFREGEHKYEKEITRSALRLGIGAHSISFLPGLTYKNFTSLEEYKNAVGRGGLPIERGFRIGADEEMRSYLFYSLSADCGGLSLDENEALARFGQRIRDRFPDEIRALEEEGLIKVGADSIDLTPRGVYFTSVLQRTFYNPDFIQRKEIIHG